MGNSLDSQRMLLYMALVFIGLLIYQAWVLDYGPKPEPTVQPSQTIDSNGVVADSDGPAASTGVVAASPSGDLPVASQSDEAQDQQLAASGARISVQTDLVNATISTVGGTIVGIELREYPVSLEQQDVPFTLMSDAPERFLIAQSGLQGVAGEASPTHREIYRHEADSYALSDDTDSISIPLRWDNGAGVEVVKTLTFTRGSYEVNVDYAIANTSGQPWQFNQYQQLQRKPATSDETSRFLYTYIGGVVSTEEKRYEKIDFGDMEDENLSVESTGGWVAMIQHYFAGAWIPDQETRNSFYTIHLKNRNRYIIGINSALKTVADGATDTHSVKAYIGPKIQDNLKAAAPHLELTVDYGWLTIIAQPLFWLLKKIHSFVGNWGWSIIILTMLIKLVFYKLSKASYTSMARMKKLQPKLQDLKERYGDDRAKMGQATMDLYKKEKVNPLGGCLPMIVQIPVFIALYWTLLESVELRQAPWILWIQDLAIKDPLFVLPVIMGVSMFIQQRLNPAPVDPIQAKVFMVLPVVFTVFFAWFPAGLVLYWCVNNILSIAQQYYITRHVIGTK